jgi:uncharacterized membrane protein YgcG
LGVKSRGFRGLSGLEGSTCLEKSRSLAIMHWGTLGLFVIAYAGVPVFFGKIGLLPLIMGAAIAGFCYAWIRVGRKRSRWEIMLAILLATILAASAFVFDVFSFGSLSLFAADMLAAVCAGWSFTPKRAGNYLFIIASSASILIVCSFSRNALVLVPVLIFIGLLIPIAHFSLSEHLVRKGRESSFTIKEQGKRSSSLYGLLLPAFLLLLLSSALYFAIPKPLRDPPDIFRGVGTGSQQQRSTDLESELPDVGGEEPSFAQTQWSGEGESDGSIADDASEATESGETSSSGEGSGEASSGEGGEGQGNSSDSSGGGAGSTLLFQVESPQPRLWRLRAFDAYWDGEWISSTKAVEYRSDTPSIELGRVRSELEGENLFQETSAIFHACVVFEKEMPSGSNPVAIRLPEATGGDPYIVYEDVNSNLFNARDTGPGFSYSVTSLMPTGIDLGDGKVPRDVSDRYARAGGDCPGLAELAAEATAGCETQEEKVYALLQYLREHFTFDASRTLQPGEESLDVYINGERRGDNLLAVTAMALLCRELGIPARPVLGFLPGEFNRESGMFDVYSTHMRYWVEVYFPHSGWLPFDPTPAPTSGQSETTVGQQSGQGTTLNTEIEDGRLQDPSAADQSVRNSGTPQRQIDESTQNLQSGRRVEEGQGSGAPPPPSKYDPSGVVIISMAVLAALALAFLVGRKLISWIKRRRKRARDVSQERARARLRVNDPGRFIFFTYRRMCEELASVGLDKGESETPDEYLSRVARSFPVVTPYTLPITAALKDALYGMKDIGREVLPNLEACLNYLRMCCLHAAEEEGS